MSFKIYTKTGDKGETSLLGGIRVPKNHVRIEAYGTVDELNSYLGIVRDSLSDETLNLDLKGIQDLLFTVGSNLAMAPDKKGKMSIPHVNEEDITYLEQSIDKMDEELPALKNFVIPGGELAASHCHVARCVCRRAERICVAMLQESELIDEIIIRYLNRLSDYLFTLSRYISHKNQGTETLWAPRSS